MLIESPRARLRERAATIGVVGLVAAVLGASTAVVGYLGADVVLPSLGTGSDAYLALLAWGWIGALVAALGVVLFVVGLVFGRR